MHPVHANVCDDSGCTDRYVAADGFGNWTADFNDPPGPDEFDIIAGTWLDSHQLDVDGDDTAFGISVPNPRFVVRPNGDWVEAYEWPMGASVTLEIDDSGIPGSPDYTETKTVTDWDPGNPAQTYLTFTPGDASFDVKQGQDVTMHDDATTKEHTVTGIQITGYDLDADTFDGIAALNGPVHANVCDSSGCIDRDVTADGSGNWTADFNDPPGPGDHDITYGTWLDSHEIDEDGDETAWGIDTPRPDVEARANDNSVEAHAWLEGDELHLQIDDPGEPGIEYEEYKTVEAPDPGQDTYVRSTSARRASPSTSNPVSRSH